MTICFPVSEARGLQSELSGHFGSAPAFILVDEQGEGLEVRNNGHQSHPPGQCRPLAALGGRLVHAAVVSGIGAGALRRLQAAGIAVYGAGGPTVEDNLALLRQGALTPVSPHGTCRAHGQDGCSHGPPGSGSVRHG